ncbi:MAG: hypothetical protein IT287_08785 [Bdellovibrionaceae bacterium]|nr:hypothetical protein [Pseudobdellovibrionaceae bacterium]
MSSVITAFILIFNLSVMADDFQQITTDLHRQSVEAQKQIAPLVEEVTTLEQQNAEAKAELEKRSEKAKELLVKTEKIKQEITATVSAKALEEILNIGTIGRCSVVLGSQPNEYHFSQDGISIRVIFADESSTKRPMASIHNFNHQDYYKITQTDFDPSSPNSTTGPMRGDIRLDQQKKIVHAVFRGETIKDKGPFGFFGSTLAPRGMTCITMEAMDSI